VKVTGKVNMYIIRDGVKEDIQVSNQVVTFGLDWIAQRMLASPPNVVITHAEVGASNANTSMNMTALASPIAGGRVSLDSSVRSGSKLTFKATFGPGQNTGTIHESGLFQGATGNSLCARTTFAAVNKGPLDTYGFEWEITIGG
jgi:hypothetical protein